MCCVIQRRGTTMVALYGYPGTEGLRSSTRQRELSRVKERFDSKYQRILRK